MLSSLLYIESPRNCTAGVAGVAADRSLQQGWGNRGGGNRGNPRRSNKGDVNSLSGLTSQVQGLRNRPRQSILAPTSGPASTLYQGLRKGGNSRAAAKSLADTFGSNADAAATAVASAATEGGSSTAVAEAVAQTSVAAPNIAPGGSCGQVRQHLSCDTVAARQGACNRCKQAAAALPASCGSVTCTEKQHPTGWWAV